MKKFIFGLIGIMFVSVMAFSLSSCSKEEMEPEKDKDEMAFLGTWRCYTDKAKGYYQQVTLKKDGTWIWREINEHENEFINKNSTYTYKDRYITWYLEDSVEAIVYIVQFDKEEMITCFVNKYTGERDEENMQIWVKIEQLYTFYH